MIQKGKYPVEYIGITQYYSEKHPALDIGWDTPNPPVLSALDGRSEERRVGKEGRSRGAPDH